VANVAAGVAAEGVDAAADCPEQAPGSAVVIDATARRLDAGGQGGGRKQERRRSYPNKQRPGSCVNPLVAKILH
jgi:hypothetical protein